MYAYKEQNDMGECVNARGVRYVLHMASRLYSDKRTCWKEFESREAAMEHFGLEAYVDPLAVMEEEISYSRPQENNENDLTTTE